MTLEKLTGTLIVEGAIYNVTDRYISAVFIEDNTLSEGNTKYDGEQKNKTQKTYNIPLESLNFPENFSLEDLRQRFSEEEDGRDYSFPIRYVIQPNGQSKAEVLPYKDLVAGWSDHIEDVMDNSPGRELFPELKDDAQGDK